MMSPEELVFDQAKRTADTIVGMFGSNCEVAVHDFSNLDESLIYLAGSVTNRSTGSPATNLVLEELRKPVEEVQDIPNYKTTSKNGIMLKSSTVFLRNGKNDVIGALCMNYDIDALVSAEAMLQNILNFDHPENKSENFNTSIHDVIREMVEQVGKTFAKAPASLNMDEKIEFTRQLNDKGIFLIKGSTDYVATIFGVSKFTIYNYLQKINAQEAYFNKRDVE